MLPLFRYGKLLALTIGGRLVMKGLRISLICLLMSAATMRADVALFLEEPFGAFGGMTPTGHAAIYLSRVCADTPLSLRRCEEGEQGVVLSRYHRIAKYDWIAIPLIPYLYAVDRAEEVPQQVSPQNIAALRDDYRRQHLEEVAPDESDGSMPPGDWTQLVGAAYDRTIYTFEIETTEEQDARFIQLFNSRPNQNHFNLLFHNCADFARQAIDFYYPRAIHRSFGADLGIMTPKQAAKCMVRYSKRHSDLQFSSFVITQVPGTAPRSSQVRSVLEALLKSKRYILPLTTLAVLHPYLGGGLALAWIEDGHFNPRRVADSAVEPGMIVQQMQLNRVISPVAAPANPSGMP
jgi:hypothetical protein